MQFLAHRIKFNYIKLDDMYVHCTEAFFESNI